MNDLFSSLPPKYRILIKPLLAAFILGTLFVLVGRFGLSKIESLRSQIKNTQKDENTLNQKISDLSAIGADVLDQANLSLLVLPDANPALVVISQLKVLAGNSGLILFNLKSGAEVTDKSISRIDLSFDVEGNEQGVVDFLREIQTIAPLTKVSKLKMSQSGGVVRANVITSSFWSDLPKKLPLATQKLENLTPAEENVLSQMSQMRLPAFISTQPASSAGKVNPFN